MKITPKNLFNYYIIHPLAKDLSSGEKILAVAVAILFFPATIIIYLLSLRKITVVNLADREKSLNKLAASIEAVRFGVVPPPKSGTKVPFDLQAVPDIINQKFIKEHYAKPLPHRNQVTVPIVDPQTKEKKWVLWNSLTREQKILVTNTGTHAHNQLPKATPEIIVDRHFFTGRGQAVFIEGDPRESHGNDHCTRASLFAGVFAYLYQKYHPDYEVTTQDIALCQVAAAGHDSGRQTEGPDVYDDKSAEITQQELKAQGVTSPTILGDCHAAIADKDSSPLKRKCLIAKCVQNADCAEFTRLLLTSPHQDEAGFNNSRNYLDIYREFSERAKNNNPQQPAIAKLKGDLTFDDFCYELDVLRREMNDLIHQTHQRSFRERAVNSGDYYGTVLNNVTQAEFPVLNAILLKTGIKQPPIPPEVLKKRQNIELGKAWIQYGIEKISSTSLEKISKTLSNYSTEKEATAIVAKIQNELTLRQTTEQAYKEQDASEIPISLINAYACLPQLLKNQYRDDFIKKIRELKLHKSPLDSVKQILKADRNGVFADSGQVALLDLMHMKLKKTLAAIELPGKNTAFHAQELEEAAVDLLSCYKTCESSLRDPEAQTTAALAFQKAAEIYLDLGKTTEAKKILEIAAREIKLDTQSPFYDLKKLFSDKPESDFLYLPADCGFLRKRKLRICQKKIHGTEDTTPKLHYELSLELPTQSREQLEKMLKCIPNAKKSVVDAKYFKKEKDVYHTGQSLEIGKDLKITLEPGIEIFVGNDKEYWNEYNLMRIRIRDDIPMQKVQEVLAKIGLPMAFMPSRQEDMRNEMLARSLAFRFPEVFYASLPNRLTAHIIYDKLTAAQKLIIDEDMQKAKVTLVGNDHYEMVQPHIGQEAWKGGVRALGSFIWGGSTMAATAEVMRNIMDKGLMSSEERFQNGILGLGCAPTWNYKCGSANQVFTRILTKNFFTNQYGMDNFPISGQIFILLDPQIFERMPYTYLHDRGGVRNPHLHIPIHAPQKQEVSLNFKGGDKIQERRGFAENLEELHKHPHPLNESMFDLNIGSKYIRKLVVWNNTDRYNLIAALQKAQIHHIGGIPVEQAVVVAQNLNPSLIDNFDQQENSNLEVVHDSIEYI